MRGNPRGLGGGYGGGRESPRSRNAGRAGSQPPRTGKPSDKALIISGSEGKYELINGTYEPNGMHGKYACWTTRNSNPCYLFHTGKTRWVISKELDDGTTCYAFVTDDGVENPAKCKGPWTRCNDRGEWNKDARIRCVETAVSNNPFVKLRVSLDEEMRQVKIVEEKDRQLLWKRLDRDGDGTVDLAEVEALVGDLCKSGVWPSWLGHERCLERAFEQTIEDSAHGDNQVDKENFHELLLNIFWFGKLDEVFQDIAQEDDEISFSEFQSGMDKLGIRIPANKAEEEFRKFDSDGNGCVNFSEFCVQVRAQVCPDVTDGRDKTDVAKMEIHEMMTKSSAPATAGTMVRKKAMGDFNKLEKQFKAMCNDPSQKGLKKAWSRLDYNGNNKVSLAETGKWVVENYPILNHAPALLRAHEATLKSYHVDDGFVEKKEFKTLLLNLLYYNKLFWMFEQSQDDSSDRRMDLKEFMWCCSMCGVKMSTSKAKSEFQKIDTNNGGMILFDEFCEYFVAKQCPKEMADFVTDD